MKLRTCPSAWRFRIGLAALVLLASSGEARAQSLRVLESMPRLDARGVEIPKRPPTSMPDGVSYRDCVDDQRIRFVVQLDGFDANASLQVWAAPSGTDCKVQTNRAGSPAACWPLVTGAPLQSTATVDIPVRALLSGAASGSLEPVADERVCGKVDLTNISVQFLYFGPGQPATPALASDVVIAADTVGPRPPQGVTTAAGTGQIHVSWDAPPEASSIKVFCDRLESPDGGAAGACSSPAFDAVTTPDGAFIPEHECGAVSEDATAALLREARGEPLVPRTPADPAATYAIALAAVDAFENVGPLSEPACGHAEPKAADGESGCSTTGSPLGGGGLLTAIGAAVFVTMRRRRSGRR